MLSVQKKKVLSDVNSNGYQSYEDGLFGGCPGLLDEVDLGSGHRGCCNKGAMLGTDQVQIGFGDIGTILSGLQFALEATDTCN